MTEMLSNFVFESFSEWKWMLTELAKKDTAFFFHKNKEYLAQSKLWGQMPCTVQYLILKLPFGISQFVEKTFDF